MGWGPCAENKTAPSDRVGGAEDRIFDPHVVAQVGHVVAFALAVGVVLHSVESGARRRPGSCAWRRGRRGKVGACGAGAAGSESLPYLEGGIEAAALPGGGAGMGCSETPVRGTRPTR
jgi:hypothetical protein